MATLMEELPYAAVVSSDKLTVTCTYCFASKEDRTLSRCSRCRVVHYCCRDCQKKDWADHKYECLFLDKCSPRIPDGMARLISRIALKDARTGGQEKAFNGRTLDVLMEHRDSIQKDPERAEFFICVSHVLYEFMSEKFVPKPAKLMSIFGKIITNCFTITDDNMMSLGKGLYLGLSVHDHSCQPDCFVLFDGSKALLRTPDFQKKYSPHLTISYVDLMQSNKERREQLSSQYYFKCRCELCEDNKRDEWCLSAYSSCCPTSVCLLQPAAPTLVCYECGSPSKLTVDEVITANQELQMIFSRDEKKKISDGMDINVELDKTILIFEKFRKILSPLNCLLAVFGQRIITLAFELERKQVALQYALISIDAYKRYLPVGHPELTVRLQLAAICQSFADKPTGIVMELFQQAHSSALLSHGPRHSITSSIDQMMSSYRTRLQRDQAC